jgi:PhnB protein
MKLSTHLVFPGTCEEAFHFYQRALGGTDLRLFRHADTPSDVPADWRQKVVHGSITIGGQSVAGADVRPDEYEAPRGFFVLLSVTEASAARLFQALAEGGEVKMPLAKTFWSPAFGVVVDRFGTPWEVSAEQGSPQDSAS